jgi:hypothetical protein
MDYLRDSRLISAAPSARREGHEPGKARWVTE